MAKDTSASGSELESLKPSEERGKDGDKVDAAILECRLQILESF